jgi:glycosyltransferase involved in cell wall biosynthesis
MARKKPNGTITKKLDFLGLNFDSFTRPSFTLEVKSYSKNSMLVYFDFEKFTVALKPDFVSGFPSILKYPKPGNIKVFRSLILPFLAAYHALLMFFLFGYICVRYRPKICWTENTFLAMIFGLAQKLGLCKTAVYCVGDWLVSKQEKNWVKYIGNNILWGAMDYIAASFNDIVIHTSKEIYLARNRHWGRDVVEDPVVQFPPPVSINPSATDEKRFCICFLGQALASSGLELILPFLRELNQEYGIKLKIAGPNTPFRGFIEKEIGRLGLGDIVELYGFVGIEEIHTLLNNCFCGLNLIKSENSHSIYTIPGKLIQYLQVLTPTLISKHNGNFTQVIQENNLGVVIKPEPQYVVSAIKDMFENQKDFRKSIKCYAANQSIQTVSDYICAFENKNSPIVSFPRIV